MKSWWLIGVCFVGGLLGSCGGGGGSSLPVVNNVRPVSVNLGPEGNFANGLFTSVTVCVPGTSNCQTIDNVLVDTGSSGLRILASAVALPLPGQTGPGGNSIAECALFADSFTWGPVANATVAMAGESANNLPMQVIGVSDFPGPPAGCTQTGLPPADTINSLGANGILGIGLFVQDCGSACASSGPSNPNLYYSCSSAGCVATTQSLANQVQNPVPSFPVNNNGVLIQLPALGAQGAPTASGSLIFGIGTRANNGLGGAQVYTTNDLGNFTTVYAGTSYPSSFIDSGSNALFFLSSSVTGIAQCTAPEVSFYCPPTTLSLSAQNLGQNGTSGTVPFSIANAEQLFSTGNAAFNNLGGSFPGVFDWGMPFFFGRTVFVAIDGQQTPGGPGPYWAY
jgi:hypothetical protein